VRTIAHDLSDGEKAQLWNAFTRARCGCHRDQIIGVYYPIVRRVAGKIRRGVPVQVELEELVSVGTFGLIRAVDVYDPLRGVRFETVAAKHIWGTIQDEFRAADWAPRSVRRRQREYDRAIELLETALGRSPTTREVAEFMEMSASEVQVIRREVESAKIRSLDEPTDHPEALAVEIETPTGFESDLEARALYDTVEQVLRGLPAQARLVLVLYYFEGLSLSQAAEVAGLPEHRVSALHADTVLGLRDQLIQLLEPVAV
jgi:RNA polymerase sigma factor for flagellar operon FliA